MEAYYIIVLKKAYVFLNTYSKIEPMIVGKSTWMEFGEPGYNFQTITKWRSYHFCDTMVLAPATTQTYQWMIWNNACKDG